METSQSTPAADNVVHSVVCVNRSLSLRVSVYNFEQLADPFRSEFHNFFKVDCLHDRSWRSHFVITLMRENVPLFSRALSSIPRKTRVFTASRASSCPFSNANFSGFIRSACPPPQKVALYDGVRHTTRCCASPAAAAAVRCFRCAAATSLLRYAWGFPGAKWAH